MYLDIIILKETKMKRIIALIIFTAILLTSIPACASKSTEVMARELYDMGLFKGTGSTFALESLELDRNATRAEACITVIRLLGKEQKAIYQQNPHPFNDVPSWAAHQIGWLYENYLVNGVGPVYFGAYDIATVQQFSAMLLRVLGYDDSRGDFSYGNAVSFAKSIGLLDSGIAGRYELSRNDMVTMSYNALKLPIKNSRRKLIGKLCDEKVVNPDVANSYGLTAQTSLSDYYPDTPESLGKIFVYRRGQLYVMDLDKPVENYGIRVIARDNESGATYEFTPYKEPYLTKGKIRYQNGSPAGYLDQVTFSGLDSSKSYTFILLKTTSENDVYYITAKSGTTTL